MLISVQVEGYRCLADVTIPLRSPMVLIGPNGAGKTALLEVFTLLREVARGRLGPALSDRGGINDVLFAGGANRLTLGVTARTADGSELQYVSKSRPTESGMRSRMRPLPGESTQTRHPCSIFAAP